MAPPLSNGDICPPGVYNQDMQLTKVPLRLAPEDAHPVPADLDRTAGVITLVGGSSAVLSAFMPWLVTAAVGISLIKIDGPGALLAALAAISMCIAGFVLLRRSATAAVAIILMLLAVTQVALAVWHLADIVQAISRVDSRLVLISIIGTGLYLGVLGSVVTLAGGIVAWTKRSAQSDPRSRT
jgi:hypothetical protein